MSQVIEIEIGELKLQVHGTYHPYKHNGYYDPPDEEDFEVDKIMLGGFDITDLFDYSLEDLETQCLEKLDNGRYWD